MWVGCVAGGREWREGGHGLVPRPPHPMSWRGAHEARADDTGAAWRGRCATTLERLRIAAIDAAAIDDFGEQSWQCSGAGPTAVLCVCTTSHGAQLRAAGGVVAMHTPVTCSTVSRETVGVAAKLTATPLLGRCSWVGQDSTLRVVVPGSLSWWQRPRRNALGSTSCWREPIQPKQVPSQGCCLPTSPAHGSTVKELHKLQNPLATTHTHGG